MEIRCCGSGSKGNAYLIEECGQKLLIECGTPIHDIKQMLDWDMQNLVGCIITHAHSDHNRCRRNISHMGIRLFEPFGDDNKRQVVQLGAFKVASFEVPHDGEPCVGYLIFVGDEVILYVTDFEYIKYRFTDFSITRILIECNHMDDLLDAGEGKYSHAIRGHSSLSTVADFIRINATDKLKTVVLCHLSDASANEIEMKDTIQKIVGDEVEVFVADKGMKINESKTHKHCKAL